MSKPTLTKFPFISLSKALDRAQSLYDSDPGNKGMSVPIAFAAWDYSGKSSGGFQTVSALKQYGLVRDEGSNEDRKVKLTEDARRYFASEISADRAKYERQFALSPTALRHLAEHWNYSCPPDNVARTYLKSDIGLNEQSARSLLGIYKDNQKFFLGEADDAAPEDDSVLDDDGVGHFSPAERRPAMISSEPRTSDTDRDIFSVSEGEVILISPKSLSAESHQDVSDWLDIMKRKLARKVA